MQMLRWFAFTRVGVVAAKHHSTLTAKKINATQTPYGDCLHR
jgi:hypothetical protein